MEPEFNESLIGRKIKALVDYPYGGGVKRDEVGVIKSIAEEYIFVNFPSQNGYLIKSSQLKNNEGKVELISEIPESKFNVGDVVNTNNEGYHYCNSEFLIKDIQSCRSGSWKEKTISEKRFNSLEKIWVYRLHYSNWYTEDCISLASFLENISKKELSIDDLTDGEYEALMKNKFKEGEYIIYLDKGHGDQFITNHIYKQRKDAECLTPEIDSRGSTTNGIQVSKWRYATSDEAMQYEREGKPYDVTILNSQSVKYKEGDIVVCIKSTRGAVGHSENLCFKCKDITNDVAFGGNQGGGVFFEQLRMATEEEKNYYNKKGGNYYINEIEKEPSNKADLNQWAPINNFQKEFKWTDLNLDVIKQGEREVPKYIVGIDPYELSPSIEQMDSFPKRMTSPKRGIVDVEHQAIILINKNNKQRKLITI